MTGEEAGEESVVRELERLVAAIPEAAGHGASLIVDLFRGQRGIEGDVGHQGEEGAPVSPERGPAYL